MGEYLEVDFDNAAATIKKERKSGARNASLKHSKGKSLQFVKELEIFMEENNGVKERATT